MIDHPYNVHEELGPEMLAILVENRTTGEWAMTFGKPGEKARIFVLVGDLDHVYSLLLTWMDAVQRRVDGDTAFDERKRI